MITELIKIFSNYFQKIIMFLNKLYQQLKEKLNGFQRKGPRIKKNKYSVFESMKEMKKEGSMSQMDPNLKNFVMLDDDKYERMLVQDWSIIPSIEQLSNDFQYTKNFLMRKEISSQLEKLKKRQERWSLYKWITANKIDVQTMLQGVKKAIENSYEIIIDHESQIKSKTAVRIDFDEEGNILRNIPYKITKINHGQLKNLEVYVGNANSKFHPVERKIANSWVISENENHLECLAYLIYTKTENKYAYFLLSSEPIVITVESVEEIGDHDFRYFGARIFGKQDGEVLEIVPIYQERDIDKHEHHIKRIILEEAQKKRRQQDNEIGPRKITDDDKKEILKKNIYGFGLRNLPYEKLDVIDNGKTGFFTERNKEKKENQIENVFFNVINKPGLLKVKMRWEENKLEINIIMDLEEILFNKEIRSMIMANEQTENLQKGLNYNIEEEFQIDGISVNVMEDTAFIYVLNIETLQISTFVRRIKIVQTSTMRNGKRLTVATLEILRHLLINADIAQRRRLSRVGEYPIFIIIRGTGEYGKPQLITIKSQIETKEGNLNEKKYIGVNLLTKQLTNIENEIVKINFIPKTNDQTK